MTEANQSTVTNYYVNPEHVAHALFYETRDPAELSKELDISLTQAQVILEFIGKLTSELDWLEDNEADDLAALYQRAVNAAGQGELPAGDAFVFIRSVHLGRPN